MQDTPFAVQIELVEGCTLSCDFCGVNGIRQKPGGFKFMSMETATNVCQQIVDAGWNPRIEFAMHGEPSMHPLVENVIARMREILGPKISLVMFSNGSGFFKNTGLNAVLEAGVNTIGLDAYEHVNIVPRLMAQYDGRYPVWHYPQQPQHNLHSGRRVGHRDIVVIQDISHATAGNHSSINSHCGGGTEPPVAPLMQRCAKPFRELSIRWDGNVALCCNDFRGIYKIGHLPSSNLVELWNHPRFNAARRMLMQSDRSFNPCNLCNARSFRLGLLPDKKGLETLPVPDDTDRALMAESVAGEPYTPVVKRSWE